MSLRKILVQYLGSCLRLPELEREVTLITTEDGKRYVEVVRCRDCKHYEDYLGSCVRNYWHFDTVPDAYCYWGERRSE